MFCFWSSTTASRTSSCWRLIISSILPTSGLSIASKERTCPDERGSDKFMSPQTQLARAAGGQGCGDWSAAAGRRQPKDKIWRRLRTRFQSFKRRRPPFYSLISLRVSLGWERFVLYSASPRLAARWLFKLRMLACLLKLIDWNRNLHLMANGAHRVQHYCRSTGTFNDDMQ